MRLIASSLLLALACGSSESPTATPPAEPRPAAADRAPSRIAEGIVESRALGVKKRYRVYLPPGYDGGVRRYPVVYLLHGLGGEEDSWVDIGLQKTADAVGLDAIVVMPDGDDSFYVNRAGSVDYEACLAGRRPFGKAARMETYCVKKGDYADYIAGDLVAHIDTAYRTIADRDHRAIAGLSMGGYGALMLAMRRPEVFSIAASHAGVASLLYAGPDPYDPGKARLSDGVPVWVNKGNRFGAHFLDIFGTDPAFWKRHDPTTLARTLEPGRLDLYLDCGTADEFRLHLGAQMLHHVLESRGIEHAFELVEGGRHDRQFWSSRLDDGLRFIQTKLGR